MLQLEKTDQDGEFDYIAADMEENTENVNEIELDTREAPVNLNDAVQRCNLVSAPVAT